MPPPPSTTAKATTAPLPTKATSQNPGLGRSPQNIAAARVVANGKMPSTTPPCDAGTDSMAMDMNRGKPITRHSPATISRFQYRMGGTGWRATRKITAATKAATTARPMPTVTTSRPPERAMRVTGSVIEKMATPIKPSPRPLISSLMTLFVPVAASPLLASCCYPQQKRAASFPTRPLKYIPGRR